MDHVDLIIGDVTGRIYPGDAQYNSYTNESTGVVRRFTSKDWSTDADGFNTITFDILNVQKDQYIRLRGTNLPGCGPFLMRQMLMVTLL